MKHAKQLLTAGLFALLLFGFAGAALLLPDGEVSQVERRRLAQVPELDWEALSGGDYSEELETYLADQFPLRQQLRTLAGGFRTALLGQKDNNGYYKTGDVLCKIDGPVQESQVLWAVDKIRSIQDAYLSDSNVYWGLIPDKGYYADAGRPGLDYDALFALLRDTLPAEMTELDLTNVLTLDDYYRTDTHWRQEALVPVADFILDALDAPAPARSYETQTLSPFYGVYYGQSALPAQAETLRYLTDAVTDSAVVRSAEEDGLLPVYTVEKFQGMDGYNVFLNGAQAVITVENPLAETDRELVLFRDSFGSSLAPLLLGGYAKVTLVDLRYISSDILADYVDFAPGGDVLFLYSASLWNSGMLLK